MLNLPILGRVVPNLILSCFGFKSTGTIIKYHVLNSLHIFY